MLETATRMLVEPFPMAFRDAVHSSIVEPINTFQWKTGETLMTSASFLVITHVIYGLSIQGLIHFTKNTPTPKWVKPFSFFHNMFMSLLSLLMLIGLLVGGYEQGRFESLNAFLCHRREEVQPGLVQFSMYIFYLSKMCEFVDTALLVLSKKKLIWLHKVHHLTTMGLVWHSMVINLPTEILCAALNCFVHVIMYFYFAIPIKAIRSSITFTQISQFVIVLAAIIGCQYMRYAVGSPCQGTPLAEAHGTALYGLYLGMFVNFFIRQYLAKPARAPKPAEAAADKPKPTETKVERKAKVPVAIEFDEMLPESVFKASVPAALRVLAKTIALGAAGVMAMQTLPEVLAVPVGALLLGMTMSWLYLVGQDCSRGSFFGSASANRWVGTIALAPLLRPLSAVSADAMSASHVWFKRLLSKLFGVSVSHIAVASFAALMVTQLGVWQMIKFWAIPFVIMHLNVGTFSTKKGNRPSYRLLFPGLSNLLEQIPDKDVTSLCSPQDKKSLNYVPLYNLEPATHLLLARLSGRRVVSRCSAARTHSRPSTRGGRAVSHHATAPVVEREGTLDKLWALSGASYLTRELLLWKRRDIALHILVGLVFASVLHPALTAEFGNLGFLPLLLLLPFVLMASGPAKAVRMLSRSLLSSEPATSSSTDEAEPTVMPTVSQITAAIPPHCFVRSPVISMLFAIRDLVFTASLTYLGFHAYHALSGVPLVLFALVFACVQGTVTTGMWVIAHECGHQAFSPYRWLNDSVGFLYHTLLLVPYWSWQYSHAKHHRATNHLLDGETHVPATRAGFDRVNKKALKSLGENGFAALSLFINLFLGWPIYLLTNATGGRRLFGKTMKEVRSTPDHFRPSSPLFPDRVKPWVGASSVGILAVLASLAFWGYHRGFGEVLVLYVGPYYGVNFWLVLYTWLQHTNPDIPHYGDEDWTWLKGALGTVDRPYGWLLDTLHHHIGSTHVVHHLFFKLPHYHAVEATKHVAPLLGKLYNYDPDPIPVAAWKVAKNCWFVEGVTGTQLYKGHQDVKSKAA